MSPRQKTIYNTFKEKESFTLQDTVDLVGHTVYANKKKHIGEALSRMIKQGYITRIKRGVFKVVVANPKPQQLDFI